VARVRYLLGNLEFADKNPSAGLQAYEEALRMDAGLRGDAALLVNVRDLLSDKKLARSALDLMVRQIGVRPAAPWPRLPAKTAAWTSGRMRVRPATTWAALTKSTA